MRSATRKTSARLWLMTSTDRPCSFKRRISSSTCVVCTTPKAAVGSSSITSLASPMMERATATDWRCPPDSPAMGVRTLGMLTFSVFKTARAFCSIASSSSAPRDAPVSSLPRKRLATTSRLSQRARS